MNVADELLRMLDNIAFNAGYPRYLQNQSALVDHQIYFDICQIIFPELNIKLMKIKEYGPLTPTQKMQDLIDLLSDELNIDLSNISGKSIMSYNFEHIHKFLVVLETFSKDYMERMNPSRRRINSDPAYNQTGEQMRNPMSARAMVGRKEDEDYLEGGRGRSGSKGKAKANEAEQEYLIKKKGKVKRYGYSAGKKAVRNQKEQRANIHQSLVKIIMNEKNRAMKATQRQNRKSQHQDLLRARNSYKHYLNAYSKENISRRNRQAYLDEKVEKAKGKERKILPHKQMSQIENFFDSFANQFRDKKAVYLRKIQQLVRTQQADRMHYQHRIERQLSHQLKSMLNRQISGLAHQHHVRHSLLQQKSSTVFNSIDLMKKEQSRKARDFQKEMKMSKKDDLNKIENFIRQENEKMLMTLEEGGRLEKCIMDMYKRM